MDIKEHNNLNSIVIELPAYFPEGTVLKTQHNNQAEKRRMATGTND